MKKILTKVLVLLPLAALQVLWLLLLMKFLAPFSTLISLALTVAAFFLVLFIILTREESTYKILWLILILTFPIVGALLYLAAGKASGKKAAKGHGCPTSACPSHRQNPHPRGRPYGTDPALAGKGNRLPHFPGGYFPVLPRGR